MYSGRLSIVERGSLQQFVERHVVAPIRDGSTAFYRRRIAPIIDTYYARQEKKALAYDMSIAIPKFANRTTLISGAFTNPESTIVRHSKAHDGPLGPTILIDTQTAIGVFRDSAFIAMEDQDTHDHRELTYVSGPEINGVKQAGTFWYRYNHSMTRVPADYYPFLQTIFFTDINRIVRSKGFASLPPKVLRQPRQVDVSFRPTAPLSVQKDQSAKGIIFNNGQAIPVASDIAQLILPAEDISQIHFPQPIKHEQLPPFPPELASVPLANPPLRFDGITLVDEQIAKDTIQRLRAKDPRSTLVLS